MDFRLMKFESVICNDLVGGGPDMPPVPTATAQKMADRLQRRIEKQIAIAMSGRIHDGYTVSERCEMSVYLHYDAATDTFRDIRWPK